MLLILSNPDDGHLPLVLPKLEARGIDHLCFDHAAYPAQAQISLGFGRNGIVRRSLRYGDRTYDLAQVRAVWYRRPGRPTAGPDTVEASQRRFVEQAGERFLAGLWETLPCRWLPGTPAADRQAHNKLLQLDLAARLGFILPETLVTNDPDAFLDFYADSHGQLVSKSLTPFELVRHGADHVVSYTKPVTRRDAVACRSLRHAPVIVQAYVPKAVELRVTVIGPHLFAVAIPSQDSRATRHDWRHHDDHSIEYRPVELPEALRRRCFRLVAELGLVYGAIDLILTPEGEYVFLEINSNGQWGWIEDLTGLPIADTLIDVLTGPAGGRDHG